MEVVIARLADVEEVAKLFDRYRVFYQQSSDIEAARAFLQERFEKGDSTVFVARDRDLAIGFTQLYPSFSSVSMKPIWILNDLFVETAYRNRGVAKLLMSAAENFARETGAVKIILATQVSNIAARSLYESLGYTQDKDFDRYAFQL
jgi:ribosomal protein S18 acetylase RimI-like enzyme